MVLPIGARAGCLVGRREGSMTQVYPDASELYLDLLKKCLTRCIFETIYRPISPRKATLPIRKLAAYFDIELVKCVDPSTRAEGRDWPTHGETMIGLQRLDNLQYCVTDVLRRGIPGDLIETGVWRGGATILMRAVLKAYGDTERTVWVADSFQGCPKPDPARYHADAGDRHWTFTPLIVSPEEVKANFARYGLLDDQVRFLVIKRSEEHTSELQSRSDLVCRLLLEKKKTVISTVLTLDS